MGPRGVGVVDGGFRRLIIMHYSWDSRRTCFTLPGYLLFHYWPPDLSHFSLRFLSFSTPHLFPPSLVFLFRTNGSKGRDRETNLSRGRVDQHVFVLINISSKVLPNHPKALLNSVTNQCTIIVKNPQWGVGGGTGDRYRQRWVRHCRSSVSRDPIKMTNKRPYLSWLTWMSCKSSVPTNQTSHVL